ncbi:MAG: hypothetical protein HYR60_19315 [Acidobacteria bacterium]|nr:hypothetical protein [Acidobacteriota bacterium]
MSAPIEISPREVKALLDSRERPRLIDVREPFEFQQACIAGSELIPMRAIPQSLAALEAAEAPLVILCHHGIRSLKVASWLREQGFEDCRSMAGGIDRWSLEIDPAVPRYS